MTTDRFDAARAVADAVLYEGYVLYPYRASSRKNQARFQWGVLVPRAFSEADGSERWTSRTECLVDLRESPTLYVRLRCLQLQRRSVEALTPALETQFVPTSELVVANVRHVSWDEAVEQVVDLGPLSLEAPHQHDEDLVAFESSDDVEMLAELDGTVAGRVVRRRERVDARITVEVTRPSPSRRYAKVAVTVENVTAWHGTSAKRDDVMAQSLVAVHTILAVDGATFISPLDPPVDARPAMSACQSEGTYPVLIGDDDVVLSSPIILYDHPEIAGESPGDLYDSLEIDEILALRVMTLTDDEKAEARRTDPRAAAIIDRCDELSEESMGQLHGQMRPVPPPVRGAFSQESPVVPWWDPEVDGAYDPWSDTLWLAGHELAKGSQVRLRPSHRSDAHDIFFAGMLATVAGIFTDAEGDQHVAVTVNDDPATQELDWQGRYLFFFPDEVDPVESESCTP